MKGQLLVISGPSAGVGKDTILNLFRNAHPDWHYLVSYTSRQPRAGEVNGQDMNFIDRTTFKNWADTSRFLEWFETDGNLYGTLKSPVEELLNQNQNVVLRKDVRGALSIKKAIPESVIIILVPDSLAVLESRIRKRAQDDEATIRRRLELAKKELEYKDQFDHVIINPEDHPERALADLEKALNL